MRRLGVISLVAGLVILLASPLRGQSFPELPDGFNNVTCINIETPDGSTWIGSSGDGVLRVGRNGRSLHYRASDGRIPSDGIRSILTSSDGVIWILGDNGKLGSYSSVEGFSLYDNEPVSALAKNENGTVVALLEDGSLVELVKSAGVSNLKCTKIEIVPEEGAPNVDSVDKPSSSKPFLYIIILLLSLALAVVLFLLLKKPKTAVVDDEKTDEKHEEQTEFKPVKLPEDTPVINAPDPEFVNRVYSLIVNNISNPDFSVEEIAKNEGISRIHLNRKLKAAGSDSPSSILKRERMRLASDLIRQNKLSLSEIAAKCGFATPSYFSTAFKAYYHCSPSEFV